MPRNIAPAQPKPSTGHTCPYCKKVMGDKETIVFRKGHYWHAACINQHRGINPNKPESWNDELAKWMAKTEGYDDSIMRMMRYRSLKTQ